MTHGQDRHWDRLTRQFLGSFVLGTAASTGCNGYVTEKGLERLLPVVTRGRPPWLASFVLRMFPFDDIEETLNERSHLTEKLEGHTFVQPRFASAEEHNQVIDQLSEQGIEPAGKETEGHLLAEFYLSRPSNEKAEASIEQPGLASIRHSVPGDRRLQHSERKEAGPFTATEAIRPQHAWRSTCPHFLK